MGWPTRAFKRGMSVWRSVLSGSVHLQTARSRWAWSRPLWHRPEMAARWRQVMYRFTKPQLTKSQWVFFASPRDRTLDHAKICLITKNLGSTLARTFDFVV